MARTRQGPLGRNKGSLSIAKENGAGNDENGDGSLEPSPPHSPEGGDEDEWSSLIIEARDKPGVFLEPETLDRLAALESKRPDLWENLRARIMHDCRKVRILTIDKAIDRLNGGKGKDLQGQPLEWKDPEPWPKPVDGAELLDGVAALIRQYVHMPAPAADAVALWIAHTWLHDKLTKSTFLNLTSATKRCGKTTLMELLATLVIRPLPVSGMITPAALFRTVELSDPTLLLDEADSYFNDNPELRGIINGSQSRDSARVLRCVGEDHLPRWFKTWCAKVFSNIGSLPDTVRDRSLVIRLTRRPANLGDLPGWRDRDQQSIQDMQRKLARFVRDNADRMLTRRKKVVFPPCLHDRARDAWETLFAIADIAGGKWAGKNGRAWRAAERISADTKDETGTKETLLADIHKVFRDAGDPKSMTTNFILKKLNAMEDSPWPEWSRGSPLTPRGLARLLRPFDIKPKSICADGIATGSKTLKGYKRSAFVKVWNDYYVEDTPSPSVTPSQPLPSNDSSGSLSVTNLNPVTDTKSHKVPAANGCDGVTDTPSPIQPKECRPWGN